ncbi:MAG: GNAT family N-acetyltransferase [Candidatus Peribacteraceae bacterium]|nr:GNAT family N-acetyltransferase [Candidatus Peribacteraceae bacterium]
MPKKKNPKESELKKRVAKLPTKPGVYRWLDAKGTVLYVGKALNLRKRVTSYLTKEAQLGPWKQSLMEKAADISVTVTHSELEALILETNLIKQKKPKYNVLMKDDKNYVYVRISLQEPFPRIDLVRKPTEDPTSPFGLRRAGKAKYFGPYVSAFEIRDTLTLLRRVFPYRTCKMGIEPVTGKLPSPRGGGTEGEGVGVRVTHRDRPTPCLDYHIKQCCGPCIGCVTPDAYGSMAIEGVIDFLKGKTEDALALLSARMKAVARERKFEQAAKLRDALQTIQRLSEKQIVSDTSGEDADVFGVAVEGNRVHVVLLKERNGKVIDESSFTLLGHAENAADALTQFLPQYYVDAPDVPPLLILAENIEDPKLLTEWLSERRGSKVTMRIPERGKLPALLRLAEENACEKVQHFETSWEAAARNVSDALKELKTTLGLPTAPKRIEGYDISHLSGTETVGSMSVFVDGKPKNDQYRSFTLKTIREGEIDDYRALKEVIKRRLLHLMQDPRREEQMFKNTGITIRRARTADQKTIEKMMRHPSAGLDCASITFKEFLVAERAGTIIAFGRLHRHKDNTVELASLFVDRHERGHSLGRLIIHKLLKSVKRGKVYLVTDPPLEAYYAELGFRVIQTAPAPVLQKMRRCQKRFGKNTSCVLMMFEVAKHVADSSLSALPDLLLIDGGKGQLSAVLEILEELHQPIPVIGLAKKEEEIFVPGNPNPVTFAKDSPARFLLMRLRDEAHRFANAHRETRAKKRAVFSVLDSIPGIGPQTKVKLLKRFGSLEALKEIKDEELAHILSASQIRALREAV